jgi:hypothetical protein
VGCFILDLLKIHVMYKEIYITTASVDLHTLTVWFIPCGEYYKYVVDVHFQLPFS